MNKKSSKTGCSGAVWSSGKPSKKFCRGQDGKGRDGKHFWWSECCYWDGNSCEPKSSLGKYVDCILGPPYNPKMNALFFH